MHLLGVIWLCLIVYSFTRKFEYTIMFTIISIIFTGTAFLSVGNVTVSIFEMSSIFLIVRYILNNKGKLIMLKINQLLLILALLVIIITITDATIFKGYLVGIYGEWQQAVHLVDYDYIGIDFSLIIVLLRFLFYIFVFVVIRSYMETNCNSEKSQDMILNTFLISTYIVLIVGAIQWMYSYNVLDTHIIIDIFHNVGADAYTNGYDKLYSVFDEPSYCAPWLNAAFWGLVFYQPSFRYKKMIMTLTAIELLLTLSATGVVSFIIMFFYWLVYRKVSVKKILLTIAGIAVIIFVCIFTSQGQRLFSEVINKSTSSSGVARLFYVKDCYDKFLSTYGMGLGYGQIKSMTLISGLMAQIGLVGTTAFIYVIVRMAFWKTKENYEILVKTFFIAIVIGTEISCSGVQYAMTFWYGILLYGFAIGQRYKKHGIVLTRRKEQNEKV